MAGENKNIAMELLKDNGRDIDADKDKGADADKDKVAGAAVADADKDKVAGAAADADKDKGADADKDKVAGAAVADADKDKVAGAAADADKDKDKGAPAEINDDAVKAYLKTKGIEVENLDELKKPKKDPTPEELEQATKDLRENAIKHGLNNKLIKSSDITAYEVDAKKSPRDIMYPLMTEKWKKEEPALTQEELDERFADYYKENQKEDHWERKERTQLMQAQAKQYLLNTHAKVIGMEDVYNEYQDVVGKATAYNQLVEKVLTPATLKLEPFSIEVDMEGGGKATETYTFDFDKESIAAVKEQLLSEDSFNRLGRGEISDVALTALARNALINKEIASIVKTVARSHANKMVLATKAGRKGAIPVHTGDGTTEVNLPTKYSLADELLREAGR